MGDKVNWEAKATPKNGDPLHTGAADARAWIKTLSGANYYDWKANPRLS
jgi:hypothetical protein